MERFAGSMSWRSVVLYVIAFAVGEVGGNVVREYFPAPPVLIFKISATVSLFGLALLAGWLITNPDDARVRTMQRSVAAGFFIGFWLGYLA